MEVRIADKMKEVTKINQIEYAQLIKDADYHFNIFIYGKSGRGKTQILKQVANEMGKKVIIFSLATEMAEAIGGIPQVVQKIQEGKANIMEKTKVINYFSRLLDERLAPVIETEGRGYILFFDEMNQSIQEVMNACYSICSAEPEDREWAGHSIKYAQIVAAGNLMNGDDGTTYLNEIPTPLQNRFCTYELESSNIAVKDHLTEKWKNLKEVDQYIDILLDEDVPPRDIEGILKVLSMNKNPLLIKSKVSEPVALKLLDIKKKVDNVDPTKIFKDLKRGYEAFKVKGHIKYAGKTITEEKELLDIFRKHLSEEEIKSIIEGVE